MNKRITPGPWILGLGESNAIFGDEFGDHDGDNPLVANAFRGANYSANAQAISACPDMIAALEAMLSEKIDYMKINSLGNPDDQYTVKLAKAALNKALGNPND